MEMNEITNTPLEKGEQGTLREPCGLKDMKQGLNEPKEYETTPV